jgi:predicted molibdopterin-dependent oxidoreductase YjgC
MAEISRVAPIYREISYQALAVPAVLRRSFEYEIYEGGSFDGLGRSGKQWPTVAENPQARFTLGWIEPEASITPDAEFPLTLVARRVLFDAGTLIGQSALVRPLVPEPHLVLNAAEASRLGVVSGSRVRLTSAHGQAELVAQVDDQAPEGVALLPANLEGRQGESLFAPGAVITRVRIERSA